MTLLTSDEDWFTFTLTSTRTVKAGLTDAGTSTYLDFFDEGEWSIISTSSDAEGSFEVELAPGKYYLLVTSGTGEVGSYRMYADGK